MPVVIAETATWARNDSRHGRAWRHDRARAGGASRPRSVRGPQAHRGDARGGRPAREGRAAPARRAALLSLRHGGGAAAVRPVVREDEAARRAGARGGARWAHPDRARALGRRLHPLARDDPRLEHLAPTLVGTPHPGLVLRRVRPRDRESRRRGELPIVRGAGASGRGCAGHLVLVVAVAVLHARLAEDDRGPACVLPDGRARERPGHPVLLGGADDHVGLRVHGRGAVPHRVPARHRA